MSILIMNHLCTIKVRTYECDSYGHVNNANYLNYLEFARVEFLNDTGFDYDKLRRQGFGLLVREIRIRYLLPVSSGETITITSTPIKKGALSGTFSQVIKNGSGDTVVDAEVSWAFVNGEGKPIRIPEEFDLPQLYPETK